MTIELLTNQEMARADQLAIEAGVSGLVLMENAGRAVTRYVNREYLDKEDVIILCGPGNNGGDGYVIARVLQDQDYQVNVLQLGDPEALTGDAREMFLQWDGPVEALTKSELETLFDECEDPLIIDAIFGAGLNRPVTGDIAEIIQYINEQDLDVLAVDIPSGVHGGTGAVMGAALEADDTVTFFRFKPGHLLYPGRELCGEKKLAAIGIDEKVLKEIKPAIFRNRTALWAGSFPPIDVVGHKYNRGHAVVISGPMTKTGAARLGAKGALTVGAGLATVFSPEDALVVNACHLTAVMLEGFSDLESLKELLADKRKNAVLIGPGAGVGEETAANTLACLNAQKHVVLDADALTSFAEKPEVLFDAVKAEDAGQVVLTPHEGEFARLFGANEEAGSSDTEVSSRLERALQAAEKSGGVIVLKGADTVIASPDGRAVINDNAAPWLATAGSGDVLAGLITGLLAQGMPAFEAACAGVWIHGEAGSNFGPGLIAEDLTDMTPAILGAIYDYIG